MKRHKKHSKRKLFTLIILIFFGIFAIKITVDYMNTPSSQTVILPTTATVTEAVSDKVISTEFFSTKISSKYRVQVATDGNNPNLVQITAFEPGNSGIQVGITSNILTSEGLSGVADYNYRIKRPDLYEKVSLDLPYGSVAFKTITTENEITIFLLNSGRYASIAVSTTNSSIENITTMVDKLITAWVWL